jgi:endonuclease/exonuclease/phosphatase family metal-dependent hydrolase
MSEQKKKRLRILSRVVFFFNVLFAALLLLSYILPFVVPKSFPILSVLSLLVPVFIMINFIFMILWLIRLRKQFFLSFIVLVIGYTHVISLYKFSGNTTEPSENSLSVMSYNVRLFNIYNWIPEKKIDQKIVDLVKTTSPDVVAFQEFHRNHEDSFRFYDHKHVVFKGKKNKAGQAIFSKFPIINKGSLNFQNTPNNVIYIDILKNNDTIRIYNLHLQSLHINPQQEEISQKNTERLVKRMAKTFKMQHSQAELFEKNRRNCKYKEIILGDFNNTQFSNVYRKIKGPMKDAFVEAGKGFGSTFDYPYFPMRIDFIFVDTSFTVNSFKTFSELYSDHYPIHSVISLE